jgi:glutamyl/glutaminyl-tRNA synthetase
MKVTHVLRGEDHLTNTPRQIMLLDALALQKPQYGHLSLIVGDDGAPLSKRHGSYGLREIKNNGFLPNAIMNYLFHLGHTSENTELLDFDHLAKHFHLDKLSRSPARFDLIQLMYWQKIAVQALDMPALWDWLGEHVANKVPEAMRPLFAETIKANIEFPQDALEWASVFFQENVTLDAAEKNILSEAGEQFFVEAEQAIDKYGIDLPQVLAEMKQTLGVSGKKLFMPLRIALTGKNHGPELAQVAALLGQEKLKHRLGQAFKLASMT